MRERERERERERLCRKQIEPNRLNFGKTHRLFIQYFRLGLWRKGKRTWTSAFSRNCRLTAVWHDADCRDPHFASLLSGCSRWVLVVCVWFYLLLILSASRFLAPLLVHAPFLFSVHLHGMTIPFLSDRNSLWTHSNVTWKTFLFAKTIDLPCFLFCAAVFIHLKSLFQCCPF